jgi:hypothetical protein
MDPVWFSPGPLRALAKILKAYYTGVGTSAFELRGFFASYDASRSADQALQALEPIILLKERDMSGWTDEQLSEEAFTCATELEKSAKKRTAKELVQALKEAEDRHDAAEAATVAKRLEHLMKG